jgi:dethiobiotin synthetase
MFHMTQFRPAMDYDLKRFDLNLIYATVKGSKVKGVFITGTDTSVGKTVVCGLLAGFLRKSGVNAVTQKWVQTGEGGRYSDLAIHRRLMGLPETVPEDLLEDLCPYRFVHPSSPHLAAKREGRVVDPEVIAAAYRRLESAHDIVLVEGSGGLLVPLTKETSSCDLAARLGLSVLIVVGNRLGCINHALLTVETVRGRGIPLEGLIFNRISADGNPEELLADNIRIVGEITGAPVFGEVPFLADIAALAEMFFPVGKAFLEKIRSA